MKEKSLFSKIILLIVLAVICLLITVSIALLFGAIDSTLIDFKNLNFANMIPVLLIGVFLSCVIVGLAVMFVARTAFFKVKDYLKENNQNNGGTRQ